MKSAPDQTTIESAGDKANFTRIDSYLALPPMVTGQCADVLQVIRERQPVPSFELTANLAIPEAAARIHDLRGKGYNILTVIQPEFEFRGVIRRNVALYSLGSPEWPAPGFLDDQGGSDESGAALSGLIEGGRL